MQKIRYILMKGDQRIGTASNYDQVGQLVGCTKAHIYKYLTDDNTFSYKKINYTILDRLDEVIN